METLASDLRAGAFKTAMRNGNERFTWIVDQVGEVEKAPSLWDLHEHLVTFAATRNFDMTKVCTFNGTNSTYPPREYHRLRFLTVVLKIDQEYKWIVDIMVVFGANKTKNVYGAVNLRRTRDMTIGVIGTTDPPKIRNNRGHIQPLHPRGLVDVTRLGRLTGTSLNVVCDMWKDEKYNLNTQGVGMPYAQLLRRIVTPLIFVRLVLNRLKIRRDSVAILGIPALLRQGVASRLKFPVYDGWTVVGNQPVQNFRIHDPWENYYMPR